MHVGENNNFRNSKPVSAIGVGKKVAEKQYCLRMFERKKFNVEH
jgi:hypothetical protein